MPPRTCWGASRNPIHFDIIGTRNMAHDHGSNGHNHAAGANSKMLAIALGLTTTFLIAELIGSFVFNSLALLSDAAHMFTDSAALAIALAAVKIGQRPADDARTFGYRRFEILAAAFNALLLSCGRRLCALGRHPAV